MNHDELDCGLSQADDIVPSSGFSVSVMRRIESEAGALPPIPFPWLRAWPGICLALASLVLLATAASNSRAHSVAVPALFWALGSALVAVASLTLVFIAAKRP